MKISRFNLHQFFLASLVLGSGLGGLGLMPGRAHGSPLQDLINAAAPGSTLTLPAGTNYGLVEINKDLTLQGAGAELTVLHGGNTNRVVLVGSNLTVTLNDLKITGGTISQEITNGIGLLNFGYLKMNRCRIEQNRALQGSGGGIANSAHAELEMTDCWVVNNRANGTGGGVHNQGYLAMYACRVEGNSSGSMGGGGGIASLGALNLYDCAIRNNTVEEGGGGGILSGSGSAVLNNCTVSGNTGAYFRGTGGGINGGHPLILNNCTVSGNRAADGVGGGIYGEDIHLSHCTITRNSGSAGVDLDGGGGIYGTVLECQNTIIAGNSAPGGAPDCKGSISSQGYNFIGDASGSLLTPAVGDRIGTAAAPLDPKLGPLQNNGGPTETHALLSASPAIDQGTSGGVYRDQRGVYRPFDVLSVNNANDGADIGAYEYSVSIQAMVNAATPGSTLAIPEGDYHENVVIDRNLILQGAGKDKTKVIAQQISGFNYGHVFTIQPGVTARIKDLAVTGGFDRYTDYGPNLNNTPQGGGGVRNSGNLTMDRCVIFGNDVSSGDVGLGPHQGWGGGILNFSQGSPVNLTLNDCTVHGNRADGGGGIYSMINCTTVLNFTTVNHNVVGRTENWENVGNSGGGLNSAGNLTLNTSTISENTACNGHGGGICINSPGILTLANSTVAGNLSVRSSGWGEEGGYGSFGEGGGLYVSPPATVLIRSTILANNRSDAKTYGETLSIGPDCYGALTSQGYNLIGNAKDCVFSPASTDRVGSEATPVNPLIGPLQDNGGSTSTHALLPGSPAIDQGSRGSSATDQRGKIRPFDALTIANAQDGTDIGAFELDLPNPPVNLPPTLSSLPDQSMLMDTSTSVLSLTVNDPDSPLESLVLSGHFEILTGINDPLHPPLVFQFGGAGSQRTLVITAQGHWFGTAAITISVFDDKGASAATHFKLAVINNHLAVVTNSTPISIPDRGTASPYPSILSVSGLSGVTTEVKVKINKLNHTYPSDLALLLVGPNGQKVVLMAGAGDGHAVTDVNLEFYDSANLTLTSQSLVSDSYVPKGTVSDTTFPAPAPPGPYVNRLSIFRGSSPNGNWLLYVVDRVTGDQGRIAEGWSLTIQTEENTEPWMSIIRDISIPANTTTPPILFAYSDQETTREDLVFNKATSNPGLVPLQNIVLEGPDKLMFITPVPGQSGSSRITLSVSDGVFTTSRSFTVSVTNGLARTLDNRAGIPIPDRGPASPYPSSIDVSGLDGPITKVTITLHSVNHPSPKDLGILLVGPTGQTAFLMGHASNNKLWNSLILHFDDEAYEPIPFVYDTNPGSYQPTVTNWTSSFPSPAPPAPYGSKLSVFNGTAPNGPWSLYILDDAAGNNGNVAEGWSLTIYAKPSLGPTLSSIPDQTTSQNTATAPILFTVSDPTLPASQLTLTAQSSNPTLVPAANLLLGGSGSNRTLIVIPASNQTGTATITVSAGNGNATTSRSFGLIVVASTPESRSFFNLGSIAIRDNATALPYPSPISVAGLNGTVLKAVVTVHGFSHTWPADVRLLLVSPSGQKIWLMANAGYNKRLDQVTLQFDDAASLALPQSAQITSGLYKPASYVSASSSMPTPAPAAPYATALSALNGSLPNGTWSLYVADASAYDQGNLLNGWGLTLTTTADNMAPALSAIADQTTTRNTATAPILFTVSDPVVTPDKLTLSAQSSNPTLVPAANLILGGSGSNRTLLIIPAADLTGSAIITLKASSGQAAATRTFSLSVVASIPESHSFSDFGAITLRDNTTALPYPSAISVAGLSGTLSQVTVTLLGLSHTWPEDISLTLVSPTGQKCWLMGHAGRNKRLDNLALQFSDTAAAGLPLLGPIVSGTFKPTSYTTRTLTTPAPAGPYATNLAVFKGQAPNGTWSLYATDDNALDQGQIAKGWLLTLTGATTGLQQVSPFPLSTVQDQAPVPFWLEADRPLPNGSVHLKLHGQAGQRYLLQASSDQVNWQDLQEVVTSDHVVEITDETQSAIRFYRALYLPASLPMRK